ncbi:DUF3795 domain-containing protein [Candidatus Bathyarchaeota archaeon]|nr:DUF3795 domain-containing protein [Candidatus Bathyarchaeota archaeon]
MGEAFSNVKDQIGFCGIWCGSCAGGNGSIAELATRLDKMVKGYGLEKWLPRQFDFKEFMSGLACIQANGVCRGCRNGGGPPTCKVRICALQKGLADCSQCSQLLECKNFEQLEKSYPSIKADLAKIASADRGELVDKWLSELKTKWPHCVLFCSSTEK